MKAFIIIVGLFSLVYGLWLLLYGEWLGFIQFSALGWAILLNSKKQVKWRLWLMLLALACALLRLIL